MIKLSYYHSWSFLRQNNNSNSELSIKLSYSLFLTTSNYWCICISLICKHNQQRVQGLHVFAFCVVNVNDWYNIRNLGSKESSGVKFKNGICAELCLKLWFESDWYVYIITDRVRMVLKATIQKQSSKQ